MMAEAKKMMDSPEFKKQMKKMSESKEFKNGAQKTGKL
jgi:tripartite-type tricarboxylate transporter receptor subunit TctC